MAQSNCWRLALPVSEFEFEPSPDRWPIVTYDSKWSVSSAEYALTPYREVAEIPAELSDQLRFIQDVAQII